MIAAILLRMQKKELDSFLSTIAPASIAWNEPQSPSLEIPITFAEQIIRNRHNKKWDLIQEIQQAHKSGKHFSRFAKMIEEPSRNIYK